MSYLLLFQNAKPLEVVLGPVGLLFEHAWSNQLPVHLRPITAVEHEMCNFIALRGLEQAHITNEGLCNTRNLRAKSAFSVTYPVT